MNELPNLEMIAAAVVAVVVMLIVIYAAIRSGRRSTERREDFMPLARFDAAAAAEILQITWAAAGFDHTGYLFVDWNNAGLMTIECTRAVSVPPYFPATIKREIYCYELTRAVDYCMLLSDMHAEMFKLVHQRANQPHQRGVGRSPQQPS